MEDNCQLELKRSVNAESGRKSKTVRDYIFDTCSDCLDSSHLCTVSDLLLRLRGRISLKKILNMPLINPFPTRKNIFLFSVSLLAVLNRREPSLPNEILSFP